MTSLILVLAVLPLPDRKSNRPVIVPRPEASPDIAKTVARCASAAKRNSGGFVYQDAAVSITVSITAASPAAQQRGQSRESRALARAFGGRAELARDPRRRRT